MSLVADTGALYALYDASESSHRAVRRVLEKESGQIIVPVLVLAELDYLLLEYLGEEAEMDFLDGVLSGGYLVEPLTAADCKRCREIIEKYRNLKPGLVDASVVATAERRRLQRILTLDERDFRAIVPKRGRPFVLLPADAEG